MDLHIKSFIGKLHKWKYLGLSLLGKTSILAAYALPIFWYYAYLDTSNKTQMKDINNTIKWFLWSSDPIYSNTYKYKSTISLKRLHLPIDKGGFNLPNIQTKIIALQCAWFTRLFHSSSTALSIIKNILNSLDNHRKADKPTFFSKTIARSPSPSQTFNRILHSWNTFNNKISYLYKPKGGFIGELNDKDKITIIATLPLKIQYGLL